MSVLRVAQTGWDRSEAAKSVEEAGLGIGVAWIELDGYRIPAELVAGVDLTMDGEGFTVPTVRFLARVEIVYVGEDGEPLPLVKRVRARRAAKKVAKRARR